MMKKFWRLIPLLVLAACQSYSMVGPGNVTTPAMQVATDQAWNKSPQKLAGNQLWTLDGQMLNAIVFLEGIEDGKPLFKVSKKAEYGVFRSNMLPNEVMELAESSLAKIMNTSATSTSNLKPITFAGSKGFQFNYTYVTDLDVPMKGLASGAIINGKLYLILYHAAETHYYGKTLPEAEHIVASARVR